MVNSPLTDALVAVSGATARFCIEEEHMRPGKVTIIRNGVDIKELAVSGETRQQTLRQLRSEWNLAPDAVLIATIARLHPQKGHVYLIEAARNVVQSYPESVFLIVGEGPERGRIERLIGDYGLADHFRILGQRPDVPALLAAADLFVLPSLTEGLSMSLLEAMAAHVPVIASAVGGSPELIQEGETGLLVPPEDSAELARAILTLLDDRDYRACLAEAGYRRVCDHFSVESMSSAYEKLIGDLWRARGRLNSPSG
jgi:glycosyltransferase involved in cell wall biosynthesis